MPVYQQKILSRKLEDSSTEWLLLDATMALHWSKRICIPIASPHDASVESVPLLQRKMAHQHRHMSPYGENVIE